MESPSSEKVISLQVSIVAKAASFFDGEKAGYVWVWELSICGEQWLAVLLR